MYDGLKTLSVEIANLKSSIRKKIDELVKPLFLHAFEEFFTKHNDVDAVRWSQYTPYFNDGDTCTFSVNDWYARPIIIAESVNSPEGLDEELAEQYGCEDEDGFIDEYQYREGPAKTFMNSIKSDLSELFSLVDDDSMELMFEDHAEITVYRDGTITVEDCNHD